MARFPWCAGALALALLYPAASFAADDRELDEIRAQIRELKASYEARIQALEQRLKDAEARGAEAPAPVATPTPTPSGASSLAAFNPAISAILSGQYANLSQDPEPFHIPGFLTGGDIGPGRRGFSLAESELTLSANVDHKFAGNLTFSIAPDNSVEVEEAYGIFTAAPAGFTPKFGRFLSAQGYLNEQHAHAWDFVDAPLAYQAFFGGQYKTDGVQLKWVAPLEHYVELGGEVGNSDPFPGSARSKNGAGSSVVSARTGGDVGESHSWLAGVSYLQTRAQDRISSGIDPSGDDVQVAFNGKSKVVAADFVWKYAPNGNPRVTNFKLQGEYLWRKEEGSLAPAGEEAPIFAAEMPYSSRQAGWYVQGVYQFMPMWRVGARFDRLDPGSVDYGGNPPLLQSVDYHPQRTSLMLDWSPSEFSRLRLQYSQAKTVAGITDNEWFVQYVLSLGAHGAHKY
jgi:hypothetical protein